MNRQGIAHQLSPLHFSWHLLHETRKQIWFTVGVLVIFRLGTHIPVAGVAIEPWSATWQQEYPVIWMLQNLLSGGAFGRMSLFSLGLVPYIIAIVARQALQFKWTLWAARHARTLDPDEIKARHQRIRTDAAMIAAALAVYFAVTCYNAGDAVIISYWLFVGSILPALVGGAVLLMWLAEQITNRGIGNGLAVIVTAGFIAELPNTARGPLLAIQNGSLSVFSGSLLMVGLAAAIAIHIFVDRSYGRVMLRRPTQHTGAKADYSHQSFLPLKLNTCIPGPPIFASVLLAFLLLVLNYARASGTSAWPLHLFTWLGPGGLLYAATYIALVFVLGFFCNVASGTEALAARQLEKSGAFVPGLKPGQRTADFLDYVATRLSAAGAFGFAFTCGLLHLIIFHLSIVSYFDGVPLLIATKIFADILHHLNASSVIGQDTWRTPRAIPLAGASSYVAHRQRKTRSFGIPLAGLVRRHNSTQTTSFLRTLSSILSAGLVISLIGLWMMLHAQRL